MVLAASLCAALLLLGCSALLWCLYKKTKHAFCPGNCLPQHLKEVGLGRAGAGEEAFPCQPALDDQN